MDSHAYVGNKFNSIYFVFRVRLFNVKFSFDYGKLVFNSLNIVSLKCIIGIFNFRQLIPTPMY